MEEKLNKAIQVVKAKIPSMTVHSDMQKLGQAVLNLLQAKMLSATFEKPTDELDEELTFILGRVRPNLGATEMQQVTQTVLHLMQAKSNCEAMDKAVKTVNKKTN